MLGMHALQAERMNMYLFVVAVKQFGPFHEIWKESQIIGGEDSWTKRGKEVTARAHTYSPYFLSSFVFVGVNNGGNKLSLSLSFSSSHLVFPSI